MKVTVIGCGYVGLITSVGLSEVGNEIYCVDTDIKKIENLKKNIPPFFEHKLEKMMIKNSLKIKYTTDHKEACSGSDVIFISVETPENIDGSSNLNYIYEASKQVSKAIDGDCIVAIKSTVPVGTCKRIQSMFNYLANDKYKVTVISNPEFLSQGTAIEDFFHSSRIVIGTDCELAIVTMKKLYKPLLEYPFNTPLLITDICSSELIKYASNSFLALKLSFVNEIANLCSEVNADIEEVTKGMGLDNRIGSEYLNSGIGFGGSCLQKDAKALISTAKKAHISLKTIKAALQVNDSQKIILTKQLLKDFNNNIEGLDVAILGASFKPNTDDLRESPSIENIKLLLEHGANVSVYDEISIIKLERIFGKSINYCASIEECIKEKKVVLIMTEWDSIKQFPLELYDKLMKSSLIYDGRNCYDKVRAKQKVMSYKSIGW